MISINVYIFEYSLETLDFISNEIFLLYENCIKVDLIENVCKLYYADNFIGIDEINKDFLEDISKSYKVNILLVDHNTGKTTEILWRE